MSESSVLHGPYEQTSHQELTQNRGHFITRTEMETNLNPERNLCAVLGDDNGEVVGGIHQD